MTEFNIRKTLRDKRKNLSDAYKKSAAIQLADQLDLVINNYSNIQKAGVYLALKEEIDTQPLIQKLWTNNIQTYCPLLHPLKPRHLFFIGYTSSTSLIFDKYGIATPVFDSNKILAPWELDIVFTPLVGFDLTGNRIGMGAGFYDSSFAYRSFTDNLTPLIGCAFDCQRLDKIHSNAWDQPLNGIITQSNYFNTNT